ncbi:MAG: DUF4832 domain-containing protein, partial [Bryobacteraceae bacterium]|nr:DUF4832 domain-containing protein [Bryobacteraceae bacterium]
MGYLLFAQTRTTVRPADTGEALRNPAMGWAFHHYDNSIEKYGLDLAPSDTVDDFPGASVIYLRLAWSYLEPEEGKFNWSIVDTPAQRWIDKGFQVAFRFSCAENGPIWEPDYNDPVFLDKLGHFLAAAAARYDGNPEVAFIDIGSFGVWGEGHTGASTRLPYDFQTVKTHLDLVLEMEHYGSSVKKGAWEDGSLFVKAIEDYRAAYATVHWYPREFYQKNKKLVDDINLRLGYRLQLLEASWPSELSRGEPLKVGYRWRNAGVAPCYPGGHPAITLKDASGGIAGVFVDEAFDVRTLPVGPPGKA